MSNAKLKDVLNFMLEVEKLKDVYRYSTCHEKIRDSTAEHTWAVSLMAVLLSEIKESKVDLLHALKICLVHDIGEYITGDIDSILVTQGKANKDNKYKEEEKVFQDLREKFPLIGDEVYSLWKEYQEKQTDEAKYANALDKMEALIHLIYSGGEYFDDAEHIATYANKAVEQFPELKEFHSLIKERLKLEFKKANFEWKEEYNN